MLLFSDPMRGPELKSLYLAIWGLAWPAFFAQGVRSIVMFISRVIVSQLGEKAYNSVGIGMLVFFVIITMIMAVAVGTTALVAQSWGSGDRKRAGLILQQSLIWGTLLSVAISIIGMPISSLIFHLMGTDPETMASGRRFLFWLFIFIPVLAPGFFLAASLRAAGDTRTPMVAGIVMGLMSLFLSYGLILGKMGLPALGTLGAALAIDGSFFAFTLILGTLFLANKTVLKLPLKGWKLDLEIGLAIFKIGIPTAVQMVVIQIGMLVYVFVINKYGDAAVSGYFTGFTVLTIAQAPCMGFQIASATLVGQSVGAKNYERAESVFRHCAILSFACMMAIGAVIYLLVTPSFLAFAFSKLSAETITHARTFIVILTIFMPLMGVAFSIGGGFRGAGDTVPPLIAAATGMYGGRILLAYVIYAVFHPPVAVIWLSMFPDLVIRILIMSIRLKTGKWKKSRV